MSKRIVHISAKSFQECLALKKPGMPGLSHAQRVIAVEATLREKHPDAEVRFAAGYDKEPTEPALQKTEITAQDTWAILTHFGMHHQVKLGDKQVPRYQPTDANGFACELEAADFIFDMLNGRTVNLLSPETTTGFIQNFHIGVIWSDRNTVTTLIQLRDGTSRITSGHNDLSFAVVMVLLLATQPEQVQDPEPKWIIRFTDGKFNQDMGFPCSREEATRYGSYDAAELVAESLIDVAEIEPA